MEEEATRWQRAADEAPTNEQMAEMAESLRAAEELMEEAQRNYRVAAVKKATVWGWSPIARDLGVSPKMLHSWHQRYCPDLEDLSGVPARERARAERAAQRAEARAEKAAREAAEMQRLAEKLRAKKAGQLAIIN